MPRDATATAAPAHQRADGAFVLGFAASGMPAVTRLCHLEQHAPLRVLFPDPDPPDPPLAAIVNCAGGLAGGDRLRQEVHLGAGACATISTAAAEKIYRSLGPDTTVVTTLALAVGAVMEWLPQETILFDGARLDRRLRATLAEDAVLLATETLVFGRAARGERFRHGQVLDAWRLLRPDGTPFWADALALGRDPEAALRADFGFAGAGALGTMLLAAPGAERHLGLMRAVTGEAAPPLRAAATVPRPGVLLARWLGEAAAVRQGVAVAIPALRAAALGLAPRLPRLWTG
jgi:urease accessory protein